MDGITISELEPVSSISGDEEIPIVQNGTTMSVTPDILRAGISAAAIVAGTTEISGDTHDSGILFNSGNVIANLATANSGMLVTDGTGLPSISNIATLADSSLAVTGGLVTGPSLISSGGIVGTKAINAQVSQTDFGNVFQLTATTDPGGDSDVRLMRHRLILEGTTGFDRAYGEYNGVEINNTSGTVAFPIYTNHNYIQNFGGAALAFVIPVFAHIGQQGTADITEGRVYDAGGSVFGAGGGRMETVIGFNTSEIGHATLVDHAIGFKASNTEAASTVVAFQSNVLPGTGKFGFFNATGADNYFKGVTTFDSPAAVAAAGTTNQVLVTISYSGDPGGTTSMRGLSSTVISTGTQNIASQYNGISGWTNNLTSGTITSGFGEAMALTSANAGATTALRGYSVGLTVSGSGTIADLAMFQADNSTFSSTGGVTTLDVFRANASGDATRVATYRGFRAVDANASSRVEGFLGQIASGTGKRNLSMTGTADNIIVGNTNFGADATTAFTVNVQGTLNVTGAATFGSVSFSAGTITSSSATAFAVGLNGAINPSFQVDDSTALQAAGLKLTGAIAAGTVALAVISSGGAANLSVDAKGTGTLVLQGTATGAITLSRATTLSAALTYGGVTLSNAVTGTGNMVLSASPTLSGTVGGALTFSGALTLSAALTYGGVTLTNAVTGTGKMLLDTNPTMTNLSDAATATALTLLNGGTTDATGTQLVLAPKVTTRVAQLVATAVGGAITLDFQLSNGGTPASVMTLLPTKAVTITSAQATSFVVGPAGATNPVLQIDSSTGSQDAGLKITGGVTSVALAGIASGATVAVSINGKGAGTIAIGNVSTGRVTITPVTTITGALTLSAMSTFAGFNYAADAQANDTYVITLSPALAAYVAGVAIYFKANTANTGAATLNVNGLGAITIVKAVSTTLANNDILAGMMCHVVYDGTNFVLMNPRAL